MRTGYEAVIRKKFADPMPGLPLASRRTPWRRWQRFRFDDPWDDRRFFSRRRQPARRRGRRVRPQPPAVDRDGEVAPPRLPRLRQHLRRPRAAVAHHRHGERDAVDRAVPGRAGAVHRAARARSLVELTQAQIKAAGGLLDGMVIWGDVAYVNGMLFSPTYWRRVLQAHRRGADPSLPRRPGCR